jgi:hypothetical protein
VQPAAVEAARLAARKVAEDSDGLLDALRLEVENARYAVDRAYKQYDKVDPDNRLVADELERRWEDALKGVREAERRLDDAIVGRQKTEPPSPERLRDLAGDFQSVWGAAGTSVRAKKRLIRTLVEEVVVNVERDEPTIELVIHWKGGIHTSTSVRKFRTGEKATDTPTDVVEVIRVLALVCADKTIAAWLSRNEIATPRGGRWTWKKVAAVRNYRSIPPASKHPAGDWMTLREAAARLGTSRQMLTKAAQRGLFEARHPLPSGPWVISREIVEQTDVDELVKCLARHRAGPAANRMRASTHQLNLMISTTSDKGAL